MSPCSTTGVFDQHLHALAQRAQQTREQGDYEAVTPAPEEAQTIVTGAAEFIQAIQTMLGTPDTKPSHDEHP